MAPSTTKRVRGHWTHHPGRALRPLLAGSGRRRWPGHTCHHSGTDSSGCSCCQRCLLGKLGREREIRLSLAAAWQGCMHCTSRAEDKAVTYSGCRAGRSSRAGRGSRCPRRCRWLHSCSRHRSGCSQGQTCAPGRLQREALQVRTSPSLLQHPVEFGQKNPCVEAAAELNAGKALNTRLMCSPNR